MFAELVTNVARLLLSPAFAYLSINKCDQFYRSVQLAASFPISFNTNLPAYVTKNIPVECLLIPHIDVEYILFLSTFFLFYFLNTVFS